MLKPLNKTGDTIIEVLISLSILGLVLGISYASVSRNIRSTQDAQERTEASTIAQNIIETIKYYSVRTNNPAIDNRLFPTVNTTETQVVCIDTRLGSPPTGPPPGQVVRPFPHDNCSVSYGGKDGVYNARVEFVSYSISEAPQLRKYNYNVIVSWQDLTGGTESQASMRYTIVRDTSLGAGPPAPPINDVLSTSNVNEINSLNTEEVAPIVQSNDLMDTGRQAND